MRQTRPPAGQIVIETQTVGNGRGLLIGELIKIMR